MINLLKKLRNEDDSDICANRHNGNAESINADPAESIKTRSRREVFRLINQHDGITSKEIAKQMGRRLNCISGRISELKKQGLVEVRGRRNACAVLRVADCENSTNNHDAKEKQTAGVN
tara:strand:- start:3031 stop:3387 length:357 start_codon:yes stop_codon:yes gene_type:complete